MINQQTSTTSKEIWKELIGYDYLYLVSNLGQVGRIQKTFDGKNYYNVTLHHKGIAFRTDIKKLIAANFDKNELLDKEELWKPIKRFEQSHRISNKHRIMRLLRLTKNTCGYYVAGITLNKKKVTRQAHRLVLTVFDRPPKDGEQCNHINSKRDDNRLINLEWCTQSENQQHSVKFGFHAKMAGEKNGNHRLKDHEVKKIKLMHRNGMSCYKISKFFDVNRSTIQRICKGEIRRDIR